MTIVEHAIPECDFSDIAVGEAFLHDGKVYVACDEHTAYYGNDNTMKRLVNAVCLNDGSLTHFCEDDVVGCPEIKVSVR